MRGSVSPHASTPGHTEKIYSLRFHPLAADVLASSSYDLTVRIWDLKVGAERLRLQGHRDQVGQFWGAGAQPWGERLPLTFPPAPRSLAWPGALMGSSWPLSAKTGACGSMSPGVALSPCR